MSVDQILTSGLLELYVIGDLTPSETLIVEQAMDASEEVRNEILEIEETLEAYALQNAVAVDPTVKPMFFAGLDFKNRIAAGEILITAPSLSAISSISDYSQWLDREDMRAPDEYESMYGKIINSDDVKTTMIVWLKDGAPDETHTDELEKFLIVEGTCDIIIGDTNHSLVSGDYLAIPLHVNHRVQVTSDIPCKIILERAAA